MGLIRRHPDVLSESAVRSRARETAAHELDAEVLASGLAVDATPARECRLDDDLIALAPVSDVGADARDRAAELVTHDERRRPWVRAEAIPVHVAAADPGHRDADDDLTVAGHGVGDVGDTDVTGSVEHGGPHGALRQTVAGWNSSVLPSGSLQSIWMRPPGCVFSMYVMPSRSSVAFIAS